MYSRISSTKNGRAAIAYCEGPGHNNNSKRNLLVLPINLVPGVDAADQMEQLWKKSRKNHTTQVLRIVISFSKKELDPDSEVDLEVAANIIKEFIDTYYPDRQCMTYLQADGKGHNLHAHCIVNHCALGLKNVKDRGKGCTKEQSFHRFLRNAIDSTASKYLKLDTGEKSKSKQSQTERVKVERAAELKALHKDLKEDDLRELLIKEKSYSYKEDMKLKIKSVMKCASSLDDFISRLHSEGIEAVTKESNKYGKYFTYNYFACPVNVKNPKSRSYKLGDEYSPDAIEKYISKRSTNKNNTVSNTVNNVAPVSTSQKSITEKKQEIIRQIIAQNNEMLASISAEKDKKQQTIKRQQRFNEEINISSSKDEKRKDFIK